MGESSIQESGIMNQRWKTDPKLHSCDTYEDNGQVKKNLEYEEVYVKNFLEQDELRDWESFERCKKLWEFCMEKVGLTMHDMIGKTVLDCGTKDGQFPEYLTKHGIGAIGIDVSEPYIKYASERSRPVVYGDVCDMEFDDCCFDFVFSHHLLGLTSDYFKGMTEMYRVLKKDGYMVNLDNIPGNKKKHFSYIDSPKVLEEWLEKPEFTGYKVIYSGRNPYWKNDNEWILLLKKENTKNTKISRKKRKNEVSED